MLLLLLVLLLSKRGILLVDRDLDDIPELKVYEVGLLAHQPMMVIDIIEFGEAACMVLGGRIVGHGERGMSGLLAQISSLCLSKLSFVNKTSEGMAQSIENKGYTAHLCWNKQASC